MGTHSVCRLFMHTYIPSARHPRANERRVQIDVDRARDDVDVVDDDDDEERW